MHTPPLDHDIPSARNRLLQLTVRPLAVDDVERRRRREHSQLAVEDDHVVRRGRAVLQSLPQLVYYSFFLSVDYGRTGGPRAMGLSECGARSK